MNNFLNLLHNEISYYEQIIHLCHKKLKNIPDGTLQISSANGFTRYYLRFGGQKKYITHKNSSLLRKLAEKEYYTKLDQNVKQRLFHLKLLINLYENNSLSSVYENLHPEKRKLFVNDLPTPENLVETFKNAEYNKNSLDPGSKHITSFGEAMRSKSEVIIAETLHNMDIPYHYEELLAMNDGTFFYPDFTLYDAENRRKIYWEHFGMLDNEAYSQSAMLKIVKYAENGITIGDNLICTFETTDFKFPTEAIKALLEEKFAA